MAGTIKHSWNGTILTIESDSGISSMDLKGSQGDIGPRGPQGAAGVSMGGGGSVDLTGYATEAYVDNAVAAVKPNVDLSNYYTRSQTDSAISTAIGNIDIPDTSGFATDDDVAQAVSDKVTKTYVDDKVAGFATEAFVSAKIAEAQLGGGESGGSIDLSGYALKSDIPTHTSDLTNDSGFLTQHQSLADYATKIYVDNAVASIEPKVDLSNYRTLDNVEFDYYIKVHGDNNNMYIYANGIQGDNNSLWIGGDGEGVFTSLHVGGQEVATQDYVTTAIANAIAALDGSEVPY